MKVRNLVAIATCLLCSCSKSPSDNNNNNNNSTPTVTPSIQGISPTQGAPGTVIMITGTNLNVITGVNLNGASVFYKIDNATQVEAVVPTTAKTGTVSVAYSQGTVSGSGNFSVLPAPDTTAPVITDLLPNNNPASGPVLILGQNIDSVKSITFGGITASIDTNFTGTVTTTVPTSLQPGVVELTLTKTNGTSTSVPFQVVSNVPTYTVAAPLHILVRKIAPYIVHVPNDWFNEYGNSADNFFVETNQGGLYGLGGPVYLNTVPFSFTVSALDTIQKTIQFVVNQGFDAYGDSINLIYSGSFTEAFDANTQRIILYDPNGRQVVLRTSL
jgi:hypothetical protein